MSTTAISFGTKRFEELSEDVRRQLASMAEAEINDCQRQLLEFIREDLSSIADPERTPHPKDLISRALKAGDRPKRGDTAQLFLKVFGSVNDS